MADTQENSGFVLPKPEQPVTTAGEGAPASPDAAQLVVTPAQEDTSSRDLMIGGGVLAVLFIAFLFAKAGYANMLVKKRISPNRANAAGWWLFIFLATIATGAVLAAVNAAKFMTLLIIGPLALVGIVSLVLMLTASRS